MSILTSLFTGLLSLYLAGTNFLAEQILTLIPAESSEITIKTDVVDTESNSVSRLPNGYQIGGIIPDILIKNADYQDANVISSSNQTDATATPLEALVNVYCTYRSANKIQATTGTGWFIHEDGIILTNAHVAQLLLLADIVGDSECVIRTGNPATPTYTAELLYISPAWLSEYASIVNEANPKGTGERDYALLYVNSALNNQPMPGKFPALAFDTELLKTSAQNSIITAAGYPAESLIQNGVETDLIPKSAATTITELMTFGTNYADLFTLGGTVVGEHGSSGGPVVNSDGQAIGLITTRGDDIAFGSGSLRAITLSYIDRTITQETGFSLVHNLTGNLPYRAALYRQTMVPFLKKYIEWELE